jgi:hypothetical protein
MPPLGFFHRESSKQNVGKVKEFPRRTYARHFFRFETTVSWESGSNFLKQAPSHRSERLRSVIVHLSRVMKRDLRRGLWPGVGAR